MQRIILFFITTFITVLFAPQLTLAKKIDARVSYILDKSTTNADVKRFAKEFNKNFSEVEPFDLTKKTNFYIYYFATDENFIQFEITRGGKEDILKDAREAMGATGDLGSESYEAFKRDQRFSTQFSSGARDLKSTKTEKPYRGTMVLFNSYGTELIQAESNGHYKTESGALKNTIRQMRRAIDKQKQKMAIPQKRRCLYCDYSDLKERQKQKLSHIAFIAHRNLLEQLYGEVSENELPRGLTPYANLYLSLEDYKTLEHIIDTDAIIFDNQLGARRLPGHLINELIKAQVSEKLIEKVATAYRKNDFQKLDISNHTPLWSAISQKDGALIQRLISLGADVNQISKVGSNYLTPLILSAQLGDVETSNILLKNGAKKNLVATNSQTAWSTAMWMAKYEHSNLLWPSDIIDVNSIEAENLLIQAAYFGQKDKVDELLAKGVSVSARGVNGDNIIISAIRGIKTFTIEDIQQSLGSTAHKIDDAPYWEIIAAAETAGLADPIISSTDSKKQSLLFHAYPDGSQIVNNQHFTLFSRLFSNGINPLAVNVNGQDADQVYQDTRFAYIDNLRNERLAEINNERRLAAQTAQENQDAAMQLASEQASKSSSSLSRSRQQAKRLESLEKMDARARAMKFNSGQTTKFVRNTSDVDQISDSEDAKKAVEKEIRDNYANELKIANDNAKQEIENLEASIERLKQDEIENAKKRQERFSLLIQNTKSNN